MSDVVIVPFENKHAEQILEQGLNSEFLELKPGEAIRGYGNTVHTTVSTPGKFSFGAAQAIAPANNAPVQFQTNRANPVGDSPL